MKAAPLWLRTNENPLENADRYAGWRSLIIKKCGRTANWHPFFRAISTCPTRPLGIATYLCPSDGQNRVIFIDEGQPRNNTNYAFNRGDWFVWGGSASAPQPGSPFRVNVTVLIAAVTDGLLGQATCATPWTPKGRSITHPSVTAQLSYRLPSVFSPSINRIGNETGMGACGIIVGKPRCEFMAV